MELATTRGIIVGTMLNHNLYREKHGILLTCLNISFCVSAGRSRMQSFCFFDSVVTVAGASIYVVEAISGAPSRLAWAGAVFENGVSGWSPSNLKVRCQTSFS